MNQAAQAVSKQDAMQMAKPWLNDAARLAGVKAFYDVPAYFKQRFELRGMKVGNKQIGGGLAGATTDLLQKAQSGNAAKDGSSREVRDSIATLNKKLANTKEGSVKNSSARNEMARILAENRKSKSLNKKKIQEETKSVLDDHTTQKVDGATAAREAIRTAATATGTRALMPAASAAIGAVSGYGKMKQAAQREGVDFNTGYIKKSIAEGTKKKWSTLKNFASTGTSLQDKIALLENARDVANASGVETGMASTAALNLMRRFAEKKSGSGSGVDNKENQTNKQVSPLSKIRNIQKTLLPRRANDNKKNTLPLAANVDQRNFSNKPSYIKRFIDRVDDFDIDELENFLEKFAEKLSEKQRGLIGKALLVRKLAKVSLVNIEILSWAGWLFLAQFVFAICALISIIIYFIAFYVVPTTVGSAVDAVVGETIGSILGWVLTTLTTGVSFLLSVMGIDLAEFDMIYIFYLFWFLGAVVGWMTLLGMYFSYLGMLAKSLSGDHSGLKLTLFGIAIIGYSLPFPFLHLFPWALGWLLAVWVYPK